MMVFVINITRYTPNFRHTRVGGYPLWGSLDIQVKGEMDSCLRRNDKKEVGVG